MAVALPEPPRITVDDSLLQKFFVNPRNAKQPGQFTKVMSITPSIQSPHVNTKVLAAQTSGKVMQIAHNFMGSSAIKTCRQIISFYRPLNEGPMAEFIVAHVLNSYQRVHKIINQLNQDIIQSFSQINGAPERVFMAACENKDVVTVAAIQFTREGEKSSACRQFYSMDTTIVPSILRSSAASSGSLQQLNHLLLEDETTPFASAVTHIRNIPVFPKMFQTLFLRKIVNDFSDYVAFYNQIENSQEVANAIGMPVRDVKNMVVDKFTEFLKNEQLL